MIFLKLFKSILAIPFLSLLLLFLFIPRIIAIETLMILIYSLIKLQEDRRTYYYDEGRKKKNKIIVKIKQFGIIRMIASIHFLNSWILYIHYNTSIIINITTINHTNNNNIVNYISYSIHFYFITIRNNPIKYILIKCEKFQIFLKYQSNHYEKLD